MKRSSLSIALIYAGCGFAVTGAVLLAPALQADNDVAAVAVKTGVSTKTFDLAVRYNEKTGGPEVYATNTTDRPQKVTWTVRTQSSSAADALSRVPKPMNEVAADPVTLTLAPHASETSPIAMPAGKKGEFRIVTLNVDGQSLVVPTQAPPQAVSMTK